MFPIPGMFKPMIRNALAGTSIKFDAPEDATLTVTTKDGEKKYPLKEIEEMINDGEIDI